MEEFELKFEAVRRIDTLGLEVEIYFDEPGQSYILIYIDPFTHTKMCVNGGTYTSWEVVLDQIKTKYERLFFSKDEEWRKRAFPWISNQLVQKIPEGWMKSFGLEWAKEINSVYNQMGVDSRDAFRLEEIDVSLGYLHQKFSFEPFEIIKIKSRYKELSYDACRYCGRPVFIRRIEIPKGSVGMCKRCFVENSK